MSFRNFTNINRLLVLPTLVCSIGAGGVAFASVTTSQPSVQNLADQAVPTPPPPSQEYYDSPLAAGTLTLQDVLEAHKPATAQAPKLPALGGAPIATATAPLMVPPVQSSTTSLMMSQGMKAVLQKVGSTTVAPIQVNAPVIAAQPQSLLQGQPASSVPQGAVAGAASDVTYQPGQAPRNLAAALASTMPPATSVAVIPQASPVALAPALQEASAAPVPSSAPSCDQKVQKWEKGCNEAGYPASYVGKISGETRTGCADGVLHDVWVTNTCAPPDAATAQTAKTDGACGGASNNDFDKAPTDNLCAQGIASAVSGSGPWTWACSGVNGGAAAACTATLHVQISQGACGEANGVAVASAPTFDLCKSGTASDVSGSGPWTWMCKGAGKGHSESCIAPALATKPATFVAPVPAAKEARTASAPVFAESERTAPTPVVAPESSVAAQSSVPSERGELCGTAAETLAYEAPEHDLCRAGTASVVNGDGPWTWSCTNNEGVTSSCRTLSLNGEAPAASAAPKAEADVPAAVAASDASSPSLHAQNTLVPPAQATQELACGLAASQPSMQTPSQDLCLGGKASVVRGKGPWHWTCGSKKHKISCETPTILDGVCGSANGTLLRSAPFAGLCSSGKPSGIEGSGPWSWTCSGSGGGVDVSCAASVQETPVPAPAAVPTPVLDKVAGVCGSSANATLKNAPAEGLCASGIPSAVSGEGPWSWSCSGAKDGDVSSCSANKALPPRPAAPRTNGQCGSSNGETTASLPVSGLCDKGVASTVVGDGPWNWSCAGENGGMTVSCTAPLEPPAPIDGICGSVSGVPTRIKPQSGLCSSGIIGVVNGKGPWTWTCSGANGGAAASCVAPVSGKKGSAPVLVTPDADTEITAPTPAPVVAPSGLVTPRLVPSKAFAPVPAPSKVPAAADVSEGDVPASPGLAPTNEPVQPPSLRDSLPSAAVLQEDASGAAKSTAEHLTLDPTMSTVLFSHGSTTIEDNVLTTLDKLASALQAAPDMRITLVAYADNGNTTPRDARRLSLTRALAVRGYLSSKGISESRVDVRAEGAGATSGYLDRVDVKVND